MTWGQAAVALGSALLAVAGRDLFMALFGRRRARVDEAKILTDTAVSLTAPLREELDRLRVEARVTGQELYRLRTAIFAPDVTIDGLRELVRRGSDPTSNGRP